MSTSLFNKKNGAENSSIYSPDCSKIKNKDGEYLSYVISVDGNFASEVTVQEGKRYNSSDQKDLHYVNSSATVDEVERSDKSGNPRNLRAISQQLGGSKLALVTSYLEELKSKK